jgi:hypothetical protein
MTEQEKIKALDTLEYMHARMTIDGPINPKIDYRMYYIQRAISAGWKSEVKRMFVVCNDGFIRVR